MYMGNMSYISGFMIKDIPIQGIELVFIVFPSLLAKMAFGNLWCIVFFSMLLRKLSKEKKSNIK
jgi:SNF family Na+-dependent transporter